MLVSRKLNSATFICLLALIISRGVAVRAFFGVSRLTLYEHKDQQGDAYIMRVGSQCMSVPEGISASSIDTHGSCTAICAVPHCRTRCVKMYPGSPGHFDLSEINMDDQIMSVRSCMGF